MWTLWWHSGAPGARWSKVFEGTEASARAWYDRCAAGQGSGSLLLLDPRNRPVVRRDLIGNRGTPRR
jgi:hypothetical protein